MELNDSELREVVAYLHREVESLQPDLLGKIELGIWVFPPFPFGYLNIAGNDQHRTNFEEEALFLSGNFRHKSLIILNLFLERVIPYLLIRVRSWECYINCNGEILSEHCEENLDSVREACEKLRKRCGGGTPTVRK